MEENILDDFIPEQLEREVFEQLKGSDDFMEYLRLTMSQDIKRYFSVGSDEERAQIKGHYAFASYLKGRIKHYSKPLATD